MLLDEATPRLHKAAHFARRTLGQRDAIVLRNEVVALFPEASLTVDALAFEAMAVEGLRERDSDPEICASAIELYGGTLLPDDVVWDLVSYIEGIKEKPGKAYGYTTSRAPQSPKIEQVPAEHAQTTNPWQQTEPVKNGQKP